MSDAFKSTFHRDGTVTIWDVYAQSWLRIEACRLSESLLMSTLTDKEQERIERMVTKAMR